VLEGPVFVEVGLVGKLPIETVEHLGDSGLLVLFSFLGVTGE